MSYSFKEAGEFAEYLQSVVRLDALEKMTQDLDQELADSQRAMSKMKTLLDSIPNQNQTVPIDEALRHEDLSNYLDAGLPKLITKGMVNYPSDVDLNDVIAAMKQYAEDLKKNFVQVQPQTHLPQKVESKMEFESLDIQKYAMSLDQLSKRLANIKLTNGTDNRNMDLEAKLDQLCQDVNMFTKMVQARTTIGECNQNSSPALQNNSALYYDNIINKLLSGIHEVTYLLRNKN